MEDPHGACDTTPPTDPLPKALRPEKADGPCLCTLSGTGAASQRGGDVGGWVVFSSSTSQEIIKQIYCRRTVFGVPCEQTERGNGSTSGHWGR